MVVKTEMATEELTEIATKFLRDNFHMVLAIPIVRNNRLRVRMGCFYATTDDIPDSIEIAGFVIEHGTREVVLDTLYHECVHYALCSRGDPYDDGHPVFEAELRRLGISSTESNRVGMFIKYNCAGCGVATETGNMRVLRYPQGYRSGCCGGELINLSKRIYNGTEAKEWRSVY